MAEARATARPLIRSVVPLAGKRLLLTLNTGSELVLNMKNRLHTTRFYPLNDDAVFNSVTTDGFLLHFEVKSNYALDFTLREALRMSVSAPEENCCEGQETEL